jgi:hypothetical protein
LGGIFGTQVGARRGLGVRKGHASPSQSQGLLLGGRVAAPPIICAAGDFFLRLAVKKAPNQYPFVRNAL